MQSLSIPRTLYMLRYCILYQTVAFEIELNFSSNSKTKNTEPDSMSIPTTTQTSKYIFHDESKHASSFNSFTAKMPSHNKSKHI